MRLIGTVVGCLAILLSLVFYDDDSVVINHKLSVIRYVTIHGSMKERFLLSIGVGCQMLRTVSRFVEDSSIPKERDIDISFIVSTPRAGTTNFQESIGMPGSRPIDQLMIRPRIRSVFEFPGALGHVRTLVHWFDVPDHRMDLFDYNEDDFYLVFHRFKTQGSFLFWPCMLRDEHMIRRVATLSKNDVDFLMDNIRTTIAMRGQTSTKQTKTKNVQYLGCLMGVAPMLPYLTEKYHPKYIVMTR